MHLIFVTSLVTTGAPESGYEVANAALLAGFRRQGVTVTEIGFKWTDSALADPANTVCLGDVDVRTDTASGKQKLRWLMAAVANGLTFSSAKLRLINEQALKNAINEAENRNGPIDGIILNGVALAGAFVKFFTALPYIYIAHNVEHLSARQNGEDAAGLVEKLLYWREARYLKALEHRLCRGACHVLTLTEDDRKSLMLDDAISTSVALVSPQPATKPKDGRIKAFDIGLIGTWTWTPNRIGLEWFLRDVVPLLPKDVNIAIAGSTPRRMRARDKRVMLLGRVLDAKDFCRQNRVIALTAQAGTGVQLKTIEAFEMGLACVATPSSMRGIGYQPDNVIIAKTACQFADALMVQIEKSRSGTLSDADGDRFRAGQLQQMDAALSTALKSLDADQ